MQALPIVANARFARDLGLGWRSEFRVTLGSSTADRQIAGLHRGGENQVLVAQRNGEIWSADLRSNQATRILAIYSAYSCISTKILVLCVQWYKNAAPVEWRGASAACNL
jgi:hypothetical protein